MPKILDMFKIKSIIYRHGIYNLQTRVLTFPDQEKLLEKVNLSYLKILKTKTLNTKSLQIKLCSCSKYVMTYRPDLYNLLTRKKTAKKVTKNWKWSFLISQQLKISNINIGHKSKMVRNKRHILQAGIVQFADQKIVWIGANSINWAFDK